MKKWAWLLISLMIVLLDQGSKHWATANFMSYDAVPILPGINLTLAYNKGVAFSLLSHIGNAWHRWVLAGFSLIMSGLIVYWIFSLPKQAKGELLALSLILGGAVGNLYDRARVGYVIDFIDVFYKKYHWPVFNVADIAICIGTILLALALCKGAAHREGL